MSKLPTDLAYIIIGYFDLTNLQTAIINDSNLAINYDQLYLFILSNHYALSPIEIERDYIDPINQNQLTSTQSFIKVLGYLDQLGYYQEFYVSSDILLALAIKSKNRQLINYYSKQVSIYDTTNVYTFNFSDFILVQAIRTGDINIVNLIVNKFYRNSSDVISESLIEAWIKHFNIVDYETIDPYYITNSFRVKLGVANIFFYPINAYFNPPKKPAELNVFALYSVKPHLLKFTIINGVKQLLGIDNNFIDIDIISQNNLITNDLLDRIDDMRLLILQLQPSTNRDYYYLLQLNILQGENIDLTSNLIENHIVNLMISVLHPQVVTLLSQNFINFDYIKHSDVIYSPMDFLPLIAVARLNVNDINSTNFALKSLWQSIWLAGLQWLAFVDQPLPI